MALEIEQDLTFQKRQWTVQRVGWVVLGLILVAALSGLLGGGSLSHRSAEQAGVTLEYDYFLRVGHSTTVRLEGPSNEVTEVEFSRGYLEHFQVESIVPEPTRAALTSSGYRYEFQGVGSALKFDLKPRRSGRVRSQVTVNNTTFEMGHFVYP